MRSNRSSSPPRTGARCWFRKRCGPPPPPIAGRFASKPPNSSTPLIAQWLAWVPLEAASAEREALAIAICLREAIETPAKTAALATPDRTLARRVVAALERWEVEVDDFGWLEMRCTNRRRPAPSHALPP